RSEGGLWKVRIDADEAEICGVFQEWLDASDNGRARYCVSSVAEEQKTVQVTYEEGMTVGSEIAGFRFDVSDPLAPFTVTGFSKKGPAQIAGVMVGWFLDVGALLREEQFISLEGEDFGPLPTTLADVAQNMEATGLNCKKPWPRDIALLEQHHSKPKYKVHRQMGKKSWTYWNGGFKSRRGGEWQQPSSSGKWEQEYGWDDQGYPSYTRSTGSGQPRMPPQEKPKEKSEAAGLVQAIQRMVTTARKAEVKARKLCEEKEQIEENWKAFQADMKKKFVRAHELYVKDTERIDLAISDGQAAQASAFQELQEAMAHPERLTVPSVAPAPQEANKAWDALLGDIEDSDEEMANTVVAHVQEKLRKVMATTPPRQRPRVAPLTPLQTEKAPKRATSTPLVDAMVGNHSPPGFGESPLGTPVLNDPYQTSPTTRLAMPSPPTTRTRSRSITRRTPIKEKGREPSRQRPSGGLSGKLEAARHAAVNLIEDDEDEPPTPALEKSRTEGEQEETN
ncbi:unnamed protein product, partial [Symbiodinium sp. CCMP2592]